MSDKFTISLSREELEILIDALYALWSEQNRDREKIELLTRLLEAYSKTG